MRYKIVEYIWIDGAQRLRSKVRVLYGVDGIPSWDFDGSSTGQAVKEDSEVILHPVYACQCPFRKGHEIALCEVWTKDKPLSSNTRAVASKIFQQHEAEKPWFGLEQEYYLLLGKQENDHYCTIGNAHPLVRKISETHLALCLQIGLQMSGTNAEVSHNQWEFQIGPCEGIHAADQLWIARFILIKLCESYGVGVSFHPKPYPDQSGSGCHVNFSTAKMRQDGGYDHIIKAIERLEAMHDEHMKVYGLDNDKRMTGEMETSNYNAFTWGIADRTTSVRINTNTWVQKKGYLEDRRPAANMDPYLVTSKILETSIAN